MKKLVTAEIMKQLDKIAIEDHGIKSTTLMENAAQSVFEKIVEHEENIKGKKVTIICGKGNNGGDGLLMGWHRGGRVRSRGDRPDQGCGDDTGSLHLDRGGGGLPLLLAG